MKNIDLQQLFKVEYDKANVLSSYPSFLDEEIDFWLNKAYNVVISQKMNGSNAIRVGFEGSSKRTSDLQNLVITAQLTNGAKDSGISNAIVFKLPTTFLYFVSAAAKLASTDAIQDITLVDHDSAKRLFVTKVNIPWIAHPVAFLENNNIKVLYDSLEYPTLSVTNVTGNITYVKQPNVIDNVSSKESKDTVVEVSDTVCYEIISTAVMLALENIESQRTSTKAQLVNIQE